MTRPNLFCDKCENMGAGEWHTCPYLVELDGDPEHECNCCKECTMNCADDV